jgi:tetratricopeptide (TPR) repeat protein
MGEGLAYFTASEQRKLARAAHPFFPEVDADGLYKAIVLLEAAAARKPREWIFWYALGDWYEGIGELAKAVRACEMCYSLRPKDPRSAYALASALRILTRARHVGDSRMTEAFTASLERFPPDPRTQYDPEASQRGLEELGMTIDQAAEKALALFEEVRAKVRGRDREFVGDHLAAMYAEFPHLEARVRFERRRNAGRRESPLAGTYEEALIRQQKLKFVYGDQVAFRNELLEIIRLCQIVAKAKPTHSGNLLLLANALSLAAGQGRLISKESHMFFLGRAGAVIRFWTGLAQGSADWRSGSKIVSGILQEIQSSYNVDSTKMPELMESIRRSLLQDALNPGSLVEMRRKLGVG